MKVTVAATQMACDWDKEGNIARAESLVNRAADAGAQIILLQELFETPYFCIDVQDQHFDLASSIEESPTIKRFQALARERELVLPISFFEQAGLTYFNSVVVIDADGSIAGHYRKSHIPDFPAYQEKFYFSPGDTGFMAIDTRYARIGVAICWDQWFPEAARAMVLQGAEVLLLANRDARPCCGQRGAGGCFQSRRTGAERRDRDGVLRLFIYYRLHRRDAGSGRPQQ